MVVVSVVLRSDPASAAVSVAAASEALQSAASEEVRLEGGFGRVGVAGLGFRGPVVGRGIRVAGFRGGGFRRGWGGWGWGLPLAGLGLGLGYYGYPYYSSYYSDPCVVWDGYDWVNICY